jgi:hypothetical protein
MCHELFFGFFSTINNVKLSSGSELDLACGQEFASPVVDRAPLSLHSRYSWPTPEILPGLLLFIMYQQYLADIIEQITWAPIPPIALRLF